MRRDPRRIARRRQPEQARILAAELGRALIPTSKAALVTLAPCATIIILFTGASRGIGAAAAIECARDVGRVIASLLGEELGWVNAQSIEVGGGYQI